MCYSKKQVLKMKLIRNVSAEVKTLLGAAECTQINS